MKLVLPNHDHLGQDHHVPGIFVLNDGMSIGQIVDELSLIAAACEAEEYQDRIIFLPLL